MVDGELKGRIGVVAIGRNEGARLGECLASIRGHEPAVYVDSGSGDGSSSLARSSGFVVIDLHPELHYSAARARNEGLARLVEIHPRLDYVMFLDGDCTLVEGWLDRAVAELDADPGLAVVAGHRRERDAGRSMFRRLADLEWAGPPGEVIACGGDAAMRVEDFLEVGGFDPSLPAGEEPELCHRLLSRGRRILRVDAEMTTHDLGEATLGPWWRRNVRHGYTAVDVSRRFPGPAGPYRRQILSAWAWGVAVPLLVPLAYFLGPSLAEVSASRFALLAASSYPVQALRLAHAARRRSINPATAMAHGLATLFAKWAHLQGQALYLGDLARRRSVRTMEYRSSRA